ncbi:MAG TPA: transketolase [Termitinemataceae bacterium]|nr:transketolase [Termitinemataceae bacterium]HOM23193.1 transketolase [Termitinemataceae bacterium]HPQ00379.1 transketolase [Termitinemataceae bacterium]
MNTHALEKVALSVRALSMDAIQKANSGHPGLPLGAAELGAVLYGEILKHDPSDPTWPDRDRFVLSAGHGSMFLYSLLHLSGYPISLEDIKNFRQVGSPCAGHPEYGMAPGIETTTGPLGQGIATAVGMAIAETMLAARFNTPDYTIVDHYTYTLVGDGCLQEGVSAEASSLAGHLGLGKLIAFYDSNHITIDGSTDLSFTENVAKRYEAYGWQVLEGSMYDLEGILSLVQQAKQETSKPTLIILTSIIGKGAPSKQGSHEAHGAPLGTEEVAAAKAYLGIPGDFYVAPEAISYFAEKQKEWKKARENWELRFNEWSKKYPDKRAQWDAFYAGKSEGTLSFPSFNIGDKVATRSASNKALVAFSKVTPNLVGGSADLQGPNAVAMPEAGTYSRHNRAGRYIHYGIREFGMAAISNGLQLHGGLRAFCATFMVFSDYLRPALRLSALMKQPVIYVLTHDSIFVGEDGPTHQPIEHLASLRAIPNVRVLRPADAEETMVAWEMAMEHRTGPTVLALTRQNVLVFKKDDPEWKNTIRTGAYIVRQTEGTPDVTIIATGSEVAMALAAADKLAPKKVRVVSMICKELFESQPAVLQNSIVPPGVRTVVCEAACHLGWEGWAKREDILSIDRFGESGPGDKVAHHLGFTVDALVALIQRGL